MNLRALAFLIAVIAAIVWLFGGGIESLQEEHTEENVLGNTIDAAKNAANQMER